MGIQKEFLILYDGLCGLCNRFVRFVLKRDKKKVFRFASLQSKLARSTLARFNKSSASLNTVFVVPHHGESSEFILEKGKAALFVLESLGGIWSLSMIFRILPESILNFFYDIVARNRYRVFGKYDTCPLPTADQKERFLDI